MRSTSICARCIGTSSTSSGSRSSRSSISSHSEVTMAVETSSESDRVAHADSHHPPGDAHSHAHPDWSTYKWVALILTAITVVEVWIFYTPFAEHRLFVPSLLMMSAAKFLIVIM